MNCSEIMGGILSFASSLMNIWCCIILFVVQVSANKGTF